MNIQVTAKFSSIDDCDIAIRKIKQSCEKINLIKIKYGKNSFGDKFANKLPDIPVANNYLGNDLEINQQGNPFFSNNIVNNNSIYSKELTTKQDITLIIECDNNSKLNVVNLIRNSGGQNVNYI